MKNIKTFLILMTALIACATNACEETPKVSEQDIPEVIIIEADSSLILSALLYGCFEKNDIKACQFSIQMIKDFSEAKIDNLSRKIFEQDQTIISQEEKINHQGKLIEHFSIREQRRDARIAKRKAEKEAADKKTAYNSLLE